MNALIVLILHLITLGLAVVIVWQGLTRRVELLSYRNIYLAGFIMFQLLSAASIITTDYYYGILPVEDPAAAHLKFLWYAILFLLLFFLSYHWFRFARWVARWFQPRQMWEGNDWLLLCVSLGFLVLAVFFRFFARGIPGVSLLAGFVPATAAAVAVVGWVWGGRRFNLPVVALGSFVLLAGVFLSTYGYYGRRGLVAVCLALAWGAYYRMGERLKPKAVLLWIAPLLLLGIFFVGAFSTVRGGIRQGAPPLEIVKSVFTTSFGKAVGNVAEGTPDAAVTMWALDAFPERHEQRHLFSLRYMLYHPIPRELWPDKPTPLALQVAILDNVKGVSHGNITLPAGVLGYAEAEGGFYALVLYAIFFGQFCRFFDEIIRQNPGNPFLILATGCAMGEVIGLARGDVAIFANLVSLAFISIWLLLLIGRFFVGREVSSHYAVG